MWDRWESIAAAQARADQEDAERREQRARPTLTPPQDAPEPPRVAVGWEAETWGAPKASPSEAAYAAQRAVWEEEHQQTVDGLVALLRSFLPPEDHDA